MSITVTNTFYSGKLIPNINAKATGIKAIYGSDEHEFFTYNFEVPFTPTANIPYENLKFIDIHGNEYNSADLVIWEKLDVGFFARKITGKETYTPQTLGFFMDDKSPIGIVDVAGSQTFGNRSFTYLSVNKDPFEPYTYEQLENVTDGFFPFDPALESNKKIAPLPAFPAEMSNQFSLNMQTLKTITATSADDRYYLPKLNTPYFLSPSATSSSLLFRAILYARPYSARP